MHTDGVTMPTIGTYAHHGMMTDCCISVGDHSSPSTKRVGYKCYDSDMICYGVAQENLGLPDKAAARDAARPTPLYDEPQLALSCKRSGVAKLQNTVPVLLMCIVLAVGALWVNCGNTILATRLGPGTTPGSPGYTRYPSYPKLAGQQGPHVRRPQHPVGPFPIYGRAWCGQRWPLPSDTRLD